MHYLGEGDLIGGLVFNHDIKTVTNIPNDDQLFEKSRIEESWKEEVDPPKGFHKEKKILTSYQESVHGERS